jgi:hypothetical protein
MKIKLCHLPITLALFDLLAPHPHLHCQRVQ